MGADSLSIEEARRVALSAQGLRGPRPSSGGVPALLRRLVAVQLDTISVLARSHAACVVPLEDWPAYAFKRRQWLAKGKRWHSVESPGNATDEVLARLRSE